MTMKLLYVLKSFANAAGTERVISDKINYLAEIGYDVTLVTYEQGEHAFPFPLYPSIRIIDLDTRFFIVGKQRIYKRPFLLSKLRKLFRIRLQKIVDGIKPDVIITTTYSFNILDIILSIKTNAYQILESHVACFSIKKSFEYQKSPLLSKVASLYDSYIFSCIKRCNVMVVLTDGDAKEWRRYVHNVVVIPNPISYYPKKILLHGGSGRRILCVGRLHEQKGFDMLIDAFAMIALQYQEWKIDIFGEGSEKFFLEKKIRHYGLEGRIVINNPTDNIYNEYQASDFLVLSSRYEGFALVLIEAMSCGLPCVAFKCKYGPEEIIEEGENGLLVENGDVRDLAEKMLWMMSHTEERLLMGNQARKSVRKYHKDAIMQKWIDLFEHLSL